MNRFLGTFATIFAVGAGSASYAQSFSLDQADITLGYRSIGLSFGDLLGGIPIDNSPLATSYIQGRIAFNAGPNFGLQFGGEYQQTSTDLDLTALFGPGFPDIEIATPFSSLDAHAYYRTDNLKVGAFVGYQMPGATTFSVLGLGIGIDPGIDITTYGLEAIYEVNKLTFEGRIGKARFSDGMVLGIPLPVSNQVSATFGSIGVDYELSPVLNLTGNLGHTRFAAFGQSAKSTSLTVGLDYYSDFGSNIPMKISGYVGANRFSNSLGTGDTAAVIGVSMTLLFGGNSNGSDRKRMFGRPHIF
jgi:hypothetical protein